MLDVRGTAELLVVAEAPGRGYRWLTLSCAAASLLALAETARSIADGSSTTSPLLLALALLLALTLGLLRAWTTTEFRFDRKLGTLSVGRRALGRPSEDRVLRLEAISAVVDRRSADDRAIELILADRSALVLIRARSTVSAALDRVARDVSKLLRLPVELGRGALLATRFEIEELVGHGGMGVVYRARDRQTGDHVAVKLLSPAGDGARAQRFARECRLLDQFRHPRIVGYVAHGETAEGQAYLAMQWLAGADLATVLAERRLSLGEVRMIVLAAAEALAVVHDAGIVHRDLKPSNFFLEGRSAAELVLLDFGVARELASDTELTATAKLVGTPHYMAPEQASSSREISPAVDVFALGCIFYECLGGRRPFEAEQLFGVLARILYDDPLPIAALRPGVPEEWVALLARMLAKSATERPRDGTVLGRELATLSPPPELAAAEPAPAETVASRVSEVATPAVSARAAEDQVLVCIVLAAIQGAVAADDGADRLESTRSAAQRFGCPIERLADGTLLATVLPKQSAVDQVRIAARCAMFLREQLPDARISLATGRAPLGPNARVGEAVDRAARLLDHSVDGDAVRLDEVSAQLLGAHFVTARDERSALLLSEKPDLDATRLLLGKPTPCVGRELELLQLQAALASAIDEATPKAALVLAPPGVGKSRLRHEFVRRVAPEADWQVMVGFGDPLSSGSPYVLLGDALRRRAGIRAKEQAPEARRLIEFELCKFVPAERRRRVSEFLGELMGVPFPADESPPLHAARGDHRVMSEQIAFAFHEFLSAECALHPVLFVLEDLQWGDALTVKLLDAALGKLSAPLFVLALGRPETERTFPKLFATQRELTLSLRPLNPKASASLVTGVLGTGIDPAAVERVVRLAAGNALFLEELIRAAAEGEAGDVPDTVLTLLQGRLSRFAPGPRAVLRAASILGETFWRAAVEQILQAWGLGDSGRQALSELVEAELVAESETSRFAGDEQYAFRHALVCEVASGLVSEADRRSGHAVAGTWLEAAGETDGIVLARHAVEAGDRPRALEFYTRAAEHSLELYDFDEALTRATLGMECGAEGTALGVLEAVRCAAFFSKGRWMDAAEVGLRALALLPQGGIYWCLTAERLMQVLPNVGAFEENERLAGEIRSIRPVAGARAPYLRALCAQLLGYAISAEHARGKACIALIDELVQVEVEPDPVARGYAQLWRGAYATIASDDFENALVNAERAVRDLETSQVVYRLSLAQIVRGFSLWGLGRLEESERAVREAKAIAQRVHDSYHVGLADWYLGLTLCESDDEARLAEADRCALTMVELDVSPIFEPTARIIRAHVAVARKDWVRAETDGRHVRQTLTGILPYSLMASAALMDSLVAQGRGAEAAVVAREDLAALAALEGPIFSEIQFRVSAAEALFAGGEQALAESTVRQALRQLERRASHIADASQRRTYLDGLRHARRARALERRWLEPARGA